MLDSLKNIGGFTFFMSRVFTSHQFKDNYEKHFDNSKDIKRTIYDV
jgi:hypothetical protein